jgi:hypothetical protein
MPLRCNVGGDNAAAGRIETAQSQAALVLSLSKPSAALQFTQVAAATVTLVRVGDQDVLQVNAQAGGFWQAEAPNKSNDNIGRWIGRRPAARAA